MTLASAEAKGNKNWIATKGTLNITATIEAINSKDLNLRNNSVIATMTIPNGRAIPSEISKIIQK